MHNQSLIELSKALNHKSISCRELLHHHLQRIRAHEDLNTFISIDEDQAFMKALVAQSIINKGEGHALTGIPMAHKDIFCTTSLPTTCASKMLLDFRSPYDAFVVQQFEQVGAILVGKTNMDEFAMGSANENSYFGPVKNPWHPDHVPGGSSGGSAAAVAARLVPFATGSDTGGSVRQPAAFCGVSGLKPTYGRVSRYGMVAFASSLDTPGIFARSAEDLAIILQVMAGFDKLDSTSSTLLVPDYSAELQGSVRNMRIGIPSYLYDDTLSSDIQQAILESIELFQKEGAEIIPIELTLQSQWIPCYYVIACAEASSNLSRFDGIRFGHRSLQAKTVEDLVTFSRSEGFGPEVKRRILMGTHVLSSGYFDAYYLQALKVRRLIQEEMLSAFSKVDLILGPSTPTTAFKLGSAKSSPKERYLADIFTVVANLAGLPALSIPVGFSNGLPIGMQLMGPHFSEAQLLRCAHHFQRLTLWHQSYPKEI